MRTMLFSVMVTLVGCGPARVGGEIDGERVGGARDAFYDTVDLDLGILGTYQYLVVMLTDFGDGCEAIADIVDSLNLTCDETCDELLPVAEQYGLVRDRYWTTNLVVNTSDGITGEFDLDPEMQDGEFTMSWTSWDASGLHDPAECEDACDAQALLANESENGESGTLELEESDDGELIGGRFEVAMRGEDQLAGSFTAHACDMAEGSVFLAF